jgi:hypothetical protein
VVGHGAVHEGDGKDEPVFAARTNRGGGWTRGADGDLNPAPLAGFQWTALLHLKRVFAVGPNAISHLDLTARNITKEDFYSIRDWLAFVPVVDLKIDQVSMLGRVRHGPCALLFMAGCMVGQTRAVAQGARRL